MLASSNGIQAKSFNILHDDKFIPSRMTREIAVDAYSSSMREYYHEGACATVPFIWESQPGTPKHSLRQTPLPPLTPPPSSFSPSATAPSTTKPTQNRQFVFPKLRFLRTHHPVRVLSTSSSPVTPLCDYYYCRRYGFQFEAEEEKSCFRSSSYCCSTFLCFSSEKCNKRNCTKRSEEGNCTRMFKRLSLVFQPHHCA